MVVAGIHITPGTKCPANYLKFHSPLIWIALSGNIYEGFEKFEESVNYKAMYMKPT
jgi:hypothetical protein